MEKIAWPLIAVLTVAPWCAAANKAAISSANLNGASDSTMQSAGQINQSKSVSVSAGFLSQPQDTNVGAVINPLPRCARPTARRHGPPARWPERHYQRRYQSSRHRYPDWHLNPHHQHSRHRPL